jgi:hypothetical protein
MTITCDDHVFTSVLVPGSILKFKKQTILAPTGVVTLQTLVSFNFSKLIQMNLVLWNPKNSSCLHNFLFNHDLYKTIISDNIDNVSPLYCLLYNLDKLTVVDK